MAHPYPHAAPPPLPPKPRTLSSSGPRRQHPQPHVYIPQNAPPLPPLPSKRPPSESDTDAHLSRTSSTGWMSYVDAANAQLAPDGSYVDDYGQNHGGAGDQGFGYGYGYDYGRSEGTTPSMPTPNASSGPSLARAFSDEYDYGVAGPATPTRRTPSFGAYTPHTNGNQNGHGLGGVYHTNAKPPVPTPNTGQDQGQDYYLYNRNYDDYAYDRGQYDLSRNSSSSEYRHSNAVYSGHANSSFDLASGTMAFPEPDIVRRSVSDSRAQTPISPPPRPEQHRHSNSDSGPSMHLHRDDTLPLRRNDTLLSSHSSLSRHSSYSSYAPSMDAAFSQVSSTI